MPHALITQGRAWLDAGLPVAMATIVRIHGSSSQPLGARMLMTTGNRFMGAVSGGCVETDVYHHAQDVLASGAARMLHYEHVANPEIEIGLNCDGQIDVLLEPLGCDLAAQLSDPAHGVQVTLCDPGQPAAPRVTHAHVTPTGDADPVLPPAVRRDARAALHADDHPRSVTYPDGRVALLEPVLPPPTLLIFGAEQIAVPLVRMARVMGFRTVVTDARPAFATREKHPDADEVIAAWPDDVVAQVPVGPRTYVVSLNHEARFEDALLRALVAGSPPRYIGAIGQRVRQDERLQRTAEAGLDLSALPPIHTPVGLDIGGKSAEEITLSILAEMVAVKNGRGGGMLLARDTDG